MATETVVESAQAVTEPEAASVTELSAASIVETVLELASEPVESARAEQAKEFARTEVAH